MAATTLKTEDRLEEAANGGEDITESALYKSSPTAAAIKKKDKEKEQNTIRQEVSLKSVHLPSTLITHTTLFNLTLTT